MRSGNAMSLAAVLIAAVVVAGCDSSAAPRQVKGRYEVDAKRNRAWILTHEGVRMRDAANPQGLAIPLPGWTWAGPPYGCPPVLVLGPRGEAVVTSDVLPVLWRVDPETLAVTVHRPALDADQDKDAGFSELAYWSRHGAWFASRGGALWKIDSQFATAQKMAPAAGAAQSCIGGQS